MIEKSRWKNIERVWWTSRISVGIVNIQECKRICEWKTLFVCMFCARAEFHKCWSTTQKKCHFEAQLKQAHIKRSKSLKLRFHFVVNLLFFTQHIAVYISAVDCIRCIKPVGFYCFFSNLLHEHSQLKKCKYFQSFCMRMALSHSF